MESYDEIVGFDYTDENEWERWVREKFLPLYEQISVILKLREYLEDFIKTNFKEVFSQRPIREILLGGVTKEGEYTPTSLAKLYKDALGIFINPNEWVAYCKAGLDPTENGIECKFEDTAFLTFISEIKELVEELLSKIGIEPQKIEDRKIKEITNSPEKFLEIIRELYKSIVSISVNYDYHMFFILNTRCIPRFYIEKAYPKLKENFEKVANILALEEKFVPNTSDERVRRNYTLIGHKEGGFADILFSIQHTLWDYLNFSRDSFWDGEKWIDLKGIKEIFLLTVTPENLMEKYRENISRFFSTEVGISKKIVLISVNKFDCKDCIREFEQQDTRYGYWYEREVYKIEFILEDFLIEKVEHRLSYRRSWSGKKGYTTRVHDEQLPLTTFFSNLSLPLFLGIISIVVEGNRILINSSLSD